MRLAAALQGIPVVAIVNAHVTRNFTAPLAAPQRHPLTGLFGQRIADRLMPLLAPLFFRHWARPYLTYARAHGHPGWPDLRDYLVGDCDGLRYGTLYPDLPSQAPSVPESGQYIGPLTHYPLPFEKLPPLQSPVLYITLGSVPAAEFVAALGAAVGDWPGSVVATRAGRGGSWPADWISVDYADPVLISAQVERVAWLFHAGNGSSYQLLKLWATDHTRCAGAVALPFHVEQQWNAKRLAALGLVRAIGSLHHLNATLAQALACLRAATLAPAPPALVEELTTYANAPQRAAQEVCRWL
jgi:UDP:flavonoid glycosyltransferase YjiC (YdhE family)